jgi:peptidoglycan/LPS O-acetylase OafA/YrhL
VDPYFKIFKGVIQWLAFLGAPDLNGVEDTFIIVAGVTWSLSYEWLFYIFLPVIALITKARVSLRYISLSVLGVILIFSFWQPTPIHFFSFAGGIVASLAASSHRLRVWAETRTASIAAIVCASAAVAFFSTSYGYVQIFLLSVAFTIIACGNSLFGTLTNNASRLLGEMAYSIYMLHGIILFVCFRFVIGLNSGALLSPEAHWAVVLCIVPALIVVCYFSFMVIEQPTMQSTARVTRWLRARSAMHAAS